MQKVSELKYERLSMEEFAQEIKRSDPPGKDCGFGPSGSGCP